jgi:hypothetical protein
MEDMLGRLLQRIGGIETVERLAALSGSRPGRVAGAGARARPVRS